MQHHGSLDQAGNAGGVCGVSNISLDGPDVAELFPVGF